MKRLLVIILILFVILSSSSLSYAQNQILKSLKEKLDSAELWPDKIDILNDLSYEYRTSSVDKAFEYANRALDMAESVEYFDGKIEALSNLGLISQYSGEYSKSLEYFHSALESLKDHNNDYLRAKILNNLGNLYWRTKDRELAFEYHKQSLKLRIAMGDSIGIAEVLGNLGNSFNSLQHDNDSAFYFYSRSLTIFENLKDTSGISISLNNLANIYKSRGQFEKSIEMHHRALKLDKQRNDLYGVTFGFSNLGSIYNDLGSTDSAIYYYNELLKLSEKISSLPRMRQAYNRLYGLHKKLGDYGKALIYIELFKQADDSLINQRTKNRMAEIRLEYESNIKEKELDILRAEAERKEAEIKRNNYQKLFLIIAIIIIATFAFFYWKRFKSKNRLYNELENKSQQLSEAQKVIEERNDELITINESLEQQVWKRTQELNNAYQNLLISNQRLDHFTYRSAHDLKGPIASILGLIQLLGIEVNQGDNLQSKDYLTHLKHTAEKMDALLKRIIESTQVSQKILQKQHFNVEELLEQMIEIVKVNDSDISVHCEISGERSVYNDPSILLSSLKFLLHNSIKYIDPNKSEKIILLKTESSPEGFFRVHILDNGKGVSPELIPNLFKMFSKGSQESMNPGLGLYDANLLAEKIGGEVYFDESDKEYTHFVISFPYLPTKN